MPTKTLFAGAPAFVIMAKAYSVSVRLTWDRRQSPAGHPSLRLCQVGGSECATEAECYLRRVPISIVPLPMEIVRHENDVVDNFGNFIDGEGPEIPEGSWSGDPKRLVARQGISDEF